MDHTAQPTKEAHELRRERPACEQLAEHTERPAVAAEPGESMHERAVRPAPSPVDEERPGAGARPKREQARTKRNRRRAAPRRVVPRGELTAATPAAEGVEKQIHLAYASIGVLTRALIGRAAPLPPRRQHGARARACRPDATVSPEGPESTQPPPSIDPAGGACMRQASARNAMETPLPACRGRRMDERLHRHGRLARCHALGHARDGAA